MISRAAVPVSGIAIYIEAYSSFQTIQKYNSKSIKIGFNPTKVSMAKLTACIIWSNFN